MRNVGKRKRKFSQTCHHKQYSKIIINNNELTEIKIKKTIFFVIFEYN